MRGMIGITPKATERPCYPFVVADWACITCRAKPIAARHGAHTPSLVPRIPRKAETMKTRTSRALKFATFSATFDSVDACRIFACRVADLIVDTGLNAYGAVDYSGAGTLRVDVDVTAEDSGKLELLAESVKRAFTF